MTVLPDAFDVRLAQGGDREAFARLVGRHARRVHDLARRMLRDPHEAEDVAQQAFFNAWRALERFDLQRPFRHWLLRITSNLCRNRLAARGRRKELRPRGGDEAVPDVEDPHPPAPRSAPGGPGAVQQAIERLPQRYRLPVILHYVQGLPLQAVAEITERPLATVKTHLHRGRAHHGHAAIHATEI
ncbi:MAG: RNA polymerase sigma factor, partial [Planctomycetota bacterium]